MQVLIDALPPAKEFDETAPSSPNQANGSASIAANADDTDPELADLEKEMQAINQEYLSVLAEAGMFRDSSYEQFSSRRLMHLSARFRNAASRAQEYHKKHARRTPQPNERPSGILSGAFDGPGRVVQTHCLRAARCPLSLYSHGVGQRHCMQGQAL
jgi:hypothetical protein